MKVEIEVSPDIGAVLLEKAKAEGLSLDQFAARALQAAASVDAPGKKAAPDERVQAFEEFLAGFESDAVLPDAAFDRESWYPDRW
jgi:hypothetical protein